jgi:hypothetical protein
MSRLPPFGAVSSWATIPYLAQAKASRIMGEPVLQPDLVVAEIA